MAEVNYTVAQTAELVAAYEKAETPAARLAVMAEFAEKLNKSIASIRAKLVRENVYVRQPRARKRVAKKADIVRAIATFLEVNEEVVESLEKANYNTLARVYNKLAETVEAEAETA